MLTYFVNSLAKLICNYSTIRLVWIFVVCLKWVSVAYYILVAYVISLKFALNSLLDKTTVVVQYESTSTILELWPHFELSLPFVSSVITDKWVVQKWMTFGIRDKRHNVCKQLLNLWFQNSIHNLKKLIRKNSIFFWTICFVTKGYLSLWSLFINKVQSIFISSYRVFPKQQKSFMFDINIQFLIKALFQTCKRPLFQS